MLRSSDSRLRLQRFALTATALSALAVLLSLIRAQWLTGVWQGLAGFWAWMYYQLLRRM